MSYCTVDDIANEITSDQLAAITNDSDNTGPVNTGLVESKIEEVSAYMDGYLLGRYSLPIIEEEGLVRLKPICVSLVVCALYNRRFEGDNYDALANRKRNAIADLEKIQKGAIQLMPKTDAQSAFIVNVSKRQRFFGDLEDEI